MNDYVRLESEEVRGYFRVYKLNIDGDNLEGDWICTAQLLEDLPPFCEDYFIGYGRNAHRYSCKNTEV